MGAVGALVGPGLVLPAFLFTCIAGGVLAVGIAIFFCVDPPPGALRGVIVRGLVTGDGQPALSFTGIIRRPMVTAAWRSCTANTIKTPCSSWAEPMPHF